MLDGCWFFRFMDLRPEAAALLCSLAGKYLEETWFCLGRYIERHDQVLKGRVAVHNFDPAIESVLGVPGDYELHFSGRIEGDAITGTAMLAGQPQKSLGIRLH